MAMLVPEVRADAAIEVCAGGGAPFGEMVRASTPKEGRPIVDAVETARHNPQGSETWAGHGLRFRADMFDRRAADDMLRADAGYPLPQAGDVSGTPDLARAASDHFAPAGRCNLTC